MNAITVVMDSYERKGRLYPALILVAPIVTTGAAIFSVKMSALESVAAVDVACGGAFLLSQLARDAGKKSEEGLFKEWGGSPSVAVFRHRDQTLDPITKARYHTRLATL